MIVVDASVLAPALLDDDGPGQVARDVIHESPALHAPHLVHVEVMSRARRAVRSDGSLVARMSIGIELLEHLPLVVHDHLPLLAEAWRLRDRCSAYDATYVALARMLDAPLVTADRGLARAAGELCEVRLVEASS
jgi:predicted nucleic acid-binding protein